MAQRRLERELRDMERDPPLNCSAHPVSAGDLINWLEWTATIAGPEGTPYQGGIFHLSVTFPPQYPFKEPKVRFTTKVFHPNVNRHGETCLHVLHGGWSPALTLSSVLLTIYGLLVDPSPDEALDYEIARLYSSDRRKFEQQAREWTARFATDPQ